MTKQELYEFFDRRISKTAIIKRDDEWIVKGKHCTLSLEDNYTIDVWICHPADLYSGLGQRKVRNILRILEKSPVGVQFIELTGEAHAKVQGTELILQNLKLLGIRKKREISQQTAQQLRFRLKEARKVA